MRHEGGIVQVALQPREEVELAGAPAALLPVPVVPVPVPVVVATEARAGAAVLPPVSPPLPWAWSPEG
jgi:hypothetical protein